MFLRRAKVLEQKKRSLSTAVSLSDRPCGLLVKSSWLQTQRPWFDSRRYQLFWEVLDLERGPLSPVSTIELLGRKSSGFSLESREYCRSEPSLRSRDTLYPQKSALTPPTNDGRSVGIVHSWTQATEFCFVSFSFFVDRLMHKTITIRRHGFEQQSTAE
jgi:hypothetical protein